MLISQSTKVGDIQKTNCAKPVRVPLKWHK